MTEAGDWTRAFRDTSIIEGARSAGVPVRPVDLTGRQPSGGPSLGRYEDLAEIGRGGMGAVYRAVDPDLGRPVAIKVIRPDAVAGPGVVARFLREAQVTGQLQHPNIPPLHELGSTGDGRFYFVMKLVEGRSLDAVLAGPESNRRHLLAAFLKICDGVAFAHARGVVHRDLKPANIMIGEFGEVLVLDWGLARLDGDGPEEVGGQAGSDEGLTEAGTILGTPAYMSPEQAGGEPADARSDVYSLGTILYEILTLGPPFTGSLHEILARVQAGDVAPPSQRALVSRELDAVVGCAMARLPAARYPDVESLRADVEAVVEGRPVSVVRYTTAGRIAKWARREPLRAGALALLVASAITATSLANLWRREWSRAEGAASDLAGSLERERAARRAESDLRRQREAEHGRALARLHLAAALGELRAGDRDVALVHVGRSLSREESDAGWALWNELLAPGQPPIGRVQAGQPAWVAWALAPRAGLVATASGGGRIVVWSLADRRPVLLEGGPSDVRALAIGDDGTRLAAAGADGTARIWSLERPGRPVVLTGHRKEVVGVVFDPPCRRVATWSRDGTIRVWNAGGGGPLEIVERRGSVSFPRPVRFGPDGRRLVALDGARIRVWSIGEEPVFLSSAGPVGSVRFAADGRSIVAEGGDGSLRAWPVEGGDARVLGRAGDGWFELTAAPDGSVVTGSATGVLLRWPAGGGDPVELIGHDGSIGALAVDPSGERLVSASDDGAILVQTLEGEVLARWTTAARPVGVDFGPDGRSIVGALADFTIRRWSLATGTVPAESWPVERVDAIAATADRIAIASGERVLVRTGAGRPVALEGHAGPVTALAFSPGGDRLASAAKDGTVRVWDVDEGTAVVLAAEAGGPVVEVALAPGGERVLTISADGSMRHRDLAGARPVPVQATDIPNDSTGWRAIGRTGDTWRLRVEALGGSAAELSGTGPHVSAARFSPDRRWIVTVRRGGRVEVWPAVGGGPALVLDPGGDPTRRIARFSLDGRSVLAAGQEGVSRWLAPQLAVPAREAERRARLRTGLHLDETGVAGPPPLLVGLDAWADRGPVVEDLVESLTADLDAGSLGRAVEFVTGARDPALALLALVEALDGGAVARTRQDLVIEAVESSAAVEPLLALAIALLRVGPLVDEGSPDDAIDALDEALARTLLDNPDHALVEHAVRLLGEGARRAESNTERLRMELTCARLQAAAASARTRAIATLNTQSLLFRPGGGEILVHEVRSVDGRVAIRVEVEPRGLVRIDHDDHGRDRAGLEVVERTLVDDGYRFPDGVGSVVEIRFDRSGRVEVVGRPEVPAARGAEADLDRLLAAGAAGDWAASFDLVLLAGRSARAILIDVVPESGLEFRIHPTD